MSKRTPRQVADEIAALRALVPVGRWKTKTARSIQIAIDALKDGIDETSDEFSVELTEEEQMTALDAINWKNGDSDDKPSEGWGDLAK